MDISEIMRQAVLHRNKMPKYNKAWRTKILKKANAARLEKRKLEKKK